MPIRIMQFAAAFNNVPGMAVGEIISSTAGIYNNTEDYINVTRVFGKDEAEKSKSNEYASEGLHPLDSIGLR